MALRFFIFYSILIAFVFPTIFSVDFVFATAGINKQIHYQGILEDGAGSRVANGNYDMVFKIYADQSTTTPLWTGSYTSATTTGDQIAVTSGVFSVLLGSGTGNTLNLDFNDDSYYMGITVGTDTEMTPRIRVGAAGYAFNADTLDGLNASAFLDLTSWFATTTAPHITTLLNLANATTTLLTVSDQSWFTATSTFAKGISIASSTPDVTTNALYNNGSTLYWNGNTVNTGATRESAILASWDGRGDPTVSGYSFPTATLSGNASYDSTNKWVRLTPATASQNGSVEWSLNPGNAMKTSFEFRAGGGIGADATWFYVYNSSTPTGEDDASGGYIIALDEYGGDTIQVRYNGVLLGSVSPGNIDDNQWHRVDVVIENARIDVFWDGIRQISVQDQLDRDISGTRMGFGARTGSDTNNHDIRSLEITKSNSDYIFVNRASHTTTATSSVSSTSAFSSIFTPFNMGIGTTSPFTTLGISGDSHFTATSTFAKGISIASSTPDVTSNALYNNGSILYWNGSDISTATTDNWTFATNYGTTTLTATSTMPWWSQGALYASSTLTVAGNTALTNASSTLFTNSGQAWVGGITTLTGNLNFTEGANNVIGFADTNMNYGERLRVTAGNMDTADNSQGASIDFHGNNHASAGQLDLVAGGATGDITAWTNNMQRLVLDQSGLLSFGNATSSLLTVSGQSWFNISDFTATSTFAKGISIASSTPDVTSNALYNNGSILYWNGSDISTATTDNWIFATNYGTTTLTATSTMPWWSQGALYASSTLTVAGNTTFDTNTLFVDASSNRVAIGTTSPLTALQIVGGFTAGNSVTGAGDQSVGTDIINFIVGSTIASTTANTETVLRLARNGTPSDKYNPSIDFNVGSYANSGINAQTQLDIRLGEGGIHIPDTTVMSLLSSGNVGIGTTSPVATLGVNGTSYFTATSTFAKGISIASSTPDVTTNALYNNAGTLFWNGSDISTATTDNWTFATNYGTTTLTATSTMPWWSQGALYASSTLTVAGNTALTNASSTLFTNSGLSWFDGNATFDTNTLFVDASNNRVGIGTTSPVALLNVVNNDNTEGGISIDVSNTGGGAQATLGFKPNTATSSKIGQNGQLGWNITARGSNYATAGEQNDLHFEYYNGAGWVSPMHFDVTGNVGIGTTSPFTTLGISGDSYFTATSTFAKGISIASSTPDVTSNALYNNGSTLYWNGSEVGSASEWTFATNYGTTTLTATSTMPWWSQGALYASSTLTVAGNTALTNASSTLFTNSGLSWFDGNATFDTNTLFVDASNNRVGIGTTSPDSLLHVNGLALVGANSLSLGGYFPADNSQTPEGLVVYASSSATTLDNAGGIYVHNENQATGTLSSIHFSSKNTTNSNVAYSSIVGVSGARNAAFFGGDLAFYTRANNATTQSERMRITSTGNVGIGTTSPFTTLGISGDSYFTATSTFAKGISIASSTPDITSNALYNNAGTLYWNGSAVGAITGTEGQTVVMNSSGTQVATSTLFITSASRVGIGTTTPSGRLHVSNGNSGVAVNGNVDDFIVEGTDSGVGLTIASPDTSSARIAFGDQVNSIAGLIAYQHPTDDMFFGTFNGSYRMTINSAGNVGIGTTSPFTTLGISGDSYFTATSTFAKGISIASSTPDVTSNALYNNGSTLYWNGNTVNTGATRESAILASWDGRGDPTVSGYSFPTATLSGNASYDSTNKWVRLTPAVSDQDGSIEWEFNPGNAMKTSFEFRAGGGTGADATWFYVYSTTTPTDEGDANGGYIIALDEYDGDEIQVLYDTTLLGSVSPGNIDDNQWHRVDVVIENARIDVFWDGEKQISVQDKLGRDILGTKMGFGARAGGNTNNHDIRNLEVVKSNSDYLFVNRQSYTSIATSTAISTTTFSSIYTPFNFGVGTTTPASKLSVVGDIDAEFSATSTRIIGMGLNGGFVAGKTAIFRMGDVANQIEVSHGAPMDIRSFHGTRFYDNTGEIARIGINSASTDSYFNGNVGIGGETSPDFALDVYGTICQDTNSDDTCDGTVTSDERLKENVVQIEDALDKIMQLRGVHFEWDKTNSHTEFLGDGRQTGLIAQEVEVLFPELVYEDMQGYKMIDYQKLTALNLEAIKEQQEMIEVLQNELNSLSLGGSVEEFITNQELNGAFVANRILAREEICIGEEGGEVCLNKEELAELKGMLKNDQSSTINDQSISNESIINENTDSVDVESPIIILLGNNPAKIEVGSTYSDMGATVTDNVNDNLGYKVSIDGGEEMYPNELSLDTSSTTTYVITFIAEDQAGNVGTTTRIVEVGVHTPQDVGSPTSLIEGTTSTTTATELNTPKNPTDLTGQAELIQEQEPELILGCMDPDALNHDESATEDDLSCEYEEHVVEEPVSTTTPETI